jgi:hypothetical protein
VHVEAGGAIWIAGAGPTLRRLADGRAEDVTGGLPAGARVSDLLGGAGPPHVAAVQWQGHRPPPSGSCRSRPEYPWT